MNMLWGIVVAMVVGAGLACHQNCVACPSGSTTPYSCTECASGFYLQPNGRYCFNTCPSGYSTSLNNTCTGTHKKVLAVTFNSPSINWIDSVSGNVIYNGINLANNWDGNEAPYTPSRGVSFNENRVMQVDGFPRLSTAFSVSMYVFPRSTGTLVAQWVSAMQDKNTDSALWTLEIETISLDPDLTIKYLSTTGYLYYSVPINCNFHAVNVWQRLVFTIDNPDSSGTVNCVIYIQSANLETYPFSADFPMVYVANFVTQFGAQVDSQQYLSKGFDGYMYAVAIYNYPLSGFEVDAIIQSDLTDCPGPLSPAAENKYDSSNNCNAWCRTCSGSSIASCGSCPDANYYLLSGICVNACPMGFSVNATTGNCDTNSTTAVPLTFDFTYFNNSQWSRNNETYIALGSNSNFFPNYDSRDPYLIQGRGLYFLGNSYGKFGPFPSYNSVILPMNHAVGMWIRNTGGGQSVLFSKEYTDFNRPIVRLSITSDNYLSALIVRYTPSGVISQCTAQTSDHIDSAWHHVAYTVKSPLVTLKLFIDNVQKVSQTYPTYFFDSQPSTTVLGALYDSGSYSDYFSGFIAAVTIYPTNTEVFDLSSAPSSLGSYLQNVTKKACNGNCAYGCVRTNDCVLNNDGLCSVYSNYETCQTCGQRAIRWKDGRCHCKYFAQQEIDYSSVGHCSCPSYWPNCDICPVFLSSRNVTYLAFSSSYLGIEIAFSGYVNASLHSADCSKSFNATTLAQLGTEPQCSWKNETFLSVTFGVNATLVAGVMVELLPQSYVTNVTNCQSIPESEMKNTSVYVYPKIQPKARLSAPTQHTTEYGEDLVLDASASSGFLNRPGQFQWKVISDPENPALGTYFSDTFYAGKSILRVKAAAMVPATLTITVTVKNYLEETSSKSCIVIVTSGSVLQLSFNTPQMVEMTRATTRSFTVNVDVTRLPPNPNFVYKWSLAKTVPESSINPTQLFTQSAVPNTLIIPKFELDTGYQYVFRVNVTETRSQLSGYLNLYVNMTQNNITLALSRISGDVEAWKRVSLTATVTDLDSLPDSMRQVTWRCVNNSRSGCQGIELSADNATLTIPANYVAPGAKLNVTANATVAAKTEIASVVMEVLEEPVPVVSMRCPSEKVSPSSTYRCSAALTYNGASLSYRWVLSKGALSSFSPIADTSLVVQSGQMLAGQSYTFTFEVTYGLANRQMSASLKVVTNFPPSNGDFVVSPSAGEELVTNFAMSAPGWEDDDLPITYSFSYVQSGASVKIQPRTETQRCSSLLPAGSPPYSRLKVVLSVWDSLSTAASIDRDITVTAKSFNSTEVLSLLNSALSISAGSLSSVPGTCTTIGPKVVSSNLTAEELSTAYSSILGGLSQYSTMDAAPDVDSTADCLQVFSSNLAGVDSAARKSTLGLVTFLTSSAAGMEISPDLGGKLLGSIGSVLNASSDGEMTLKDVENTIESIGNGVLAKALPGESITISKPGISAQLEMHWGASLQGRTVAVAGSNSTAAIPKNFTAIAGLPSDTRYQLAAYSLPSSDSNATVLKIDLATTGQGDTRSETPLSLSVTDLPNPITFTMYASDLPANATLESASCKYYIAEKNSWSSDGVTVVAVNATSKMVTCNTTHLSVFSAGLSSAGDTAGNANIEQLGDFSNLGNLDEKNAVGIYVCGGIWFLYFGVGAIALSLDRKNANKLMEKRRAEKKANTKEEKEGTIQTSSLFLKEMQARAAKSSVLSKADISQDPDSYDSSRTITESQLPEALQRPSLEPPKPEEIKPDSPPKEKKKISFKEMILDEHMIVNILMKYNETFPRFNRLTMFLTMIMGEMFVAGLFYDSGDDSVDVKDSAEMKDFGEAVSNYSWSDFWISVYSALIMIPLGLLLAYLLSRKKVHFSLDRRPNNRTASKGAHSPLRKDQEVRRLCVGLVRNGVFHLLNRDVFPGL